VCVNTADKEDFTGLRKRREESHYPKHAAAATAAVGVVGVVVGVVAAGWTGL